MHHCKLSLIAITSLLSACMFDLNGDDNSDSSPANGELLVTTSPYVYQAGDASYQRNSITIHYDGDELVKDSYTTVETVSYVNEIPIDYGIIPPTSGPHIKLEYGRVGEGGVSRRSYALQEDYSPTLVRHHLQDNYYEVAGRGEFTRESNNDDSRILVAGERTSESRRSPYYDFYTGNEIGQYTSDSELTVIGPDNILFNSVRTPAIKVQIEVTSKSTIYGRSSKSWEQTLSVDSWIDADTGVVLLSKANGTARYMNWPDRIMDITSEVEVIIDPRLNEQETVKTEDQPTPLSANSVLQPTMKGVNAAIQAFHY